MCRQLFDALSDVCGPQNYHSNVNKIGHESQSGSAETSCLYASLKEVMFLQLSV